MEEASYDLLSGMMINCQEGRQSMRWTTTGTDTTRATKIIIIIIIIIIIMIYKKRCTSRAYTIDEIDYQQY